MADAHRVRAGLPRKKKVGVVILDILIREAELTLPAVGTKQHSLGRNAVARVFTDLRLPALRVWRG
jgi:hypothetical protein